MSLLPILRFPDTRLKKVASRVDKVDENIRRLALDMAETMYDAPGIGLAATQVDVHEQVVVIDLSEDKNQLQVFINAKITKRDGDTVYEEGCLSVPGIFDKVHRSETVTVEALNEKGEAFSLDADGLLAICIQHELDHLNGKVFVEHLSRMKQDRIKTKLKKREKEAS